MSVTTASVGEKGQHRLEVTSKSDDIKGDDITVTYSRGSETIDGDTVVGVQEGGTMQFNTDFDSKSIDPGVWQIEFTRDDSGVTRQVAVNGEGDNKFEVQVTDAAKI